MQIRLHLLQSWQSRCEEQVWYHDNWWAQDWGTKYRPLSVRCWEIQQLNSYAQVEGHYIDNRECNPDCTSTKKQNITCSGTFALRPKLTTVDDVRQIHVVDHPWHSEKTELSLHVVQPEWFTNREKHLCITLKPWLVKLDILWANHRATLRVVEVS